jgi:hypothetical protein
MLFSFVLRYIGDVGFSPFYSFQFFFKIVISFVKYWGMADGAGRVSVRNTVSIDSTPKGYSN